MVKKISILVLISLVVIGLFTFYKNSKTKAPDLIIYSYSSFAASWGAGPQIVHAFEKKNNVNIKLVDVGDGRTILQRLQFEKQNPVADVVVGLDQLNLDDAIKTVNWKTLPPTQIKYDPVTPPQVVQTSFVAFDWAPMTFIYRKGEIDPPTKVADLLDSRFKNKIVIFDPQLSIPGFLFFNWLFLNNQKNFTTFYNSFKKNIFSVSPSWSSGYGLFKKKQASLVFSYVTSPVYHWVNDHDESYQAAPFLEEVPYQIEYAGVLESSGKQMLAQQFVLFLLNQDIQKKIMNENYMYPVAAGIRLGTNFAKLPKLKLMKQENFLNKNETFELWKTLR